MDKDDRKFTLRNGFDCATCGYEDWEGVYCLICSIELCDYCCEEGNILNFTKSVQNYSNKCSKCERIGCLKCMTTCYICHMNGIESPLLCKDCTVYTQHTCHIHEDLKTCSLHHSLRCNECIADRNYESYSRWFEN